MNRRFAYALAYFLFGLSLLLTPNSGYSQFRPRQPPPQQPAVSDIVDARVLGADRLRREGKNEEALKLLDQAIWFDGDCGQCFAFRAGILGNLGRFREGFADADIGVKKSKKPRDKALAAYNKGFNLGGLGRPSEALSAYEDCITFDRTFAMCYFGKGKALVEMQRYDQATKALDEAIQLHSAYGPSWSYRAMAKAALRLGPESLSDGSMAVSLAPGDPRSYRARAYGGMANQLYQQMLEDATKALEMDAQRPGAHLVRGQALKFLGREAEAAREFDLEVDRKAVSNFLHPEKHVDLRVYNCGDDSTDIQTSSNFNIDAFEACKERVSRNLQESATSVDVGPAPKKTLPGAATPVPSKKK